MTLDQLNQLTTEQAYQQFSSCCVAQNWVDAMVQARPFISAEQLFSFADTLWRRASREDILQAFEGHPRIGDVSSLKQKYAATAVMAGHEQSGMDAATEALIDRMATRNNEYFDKFGYIFIVCASGKTADQMLALLEARLPNEADTELNIAAAEQGKIMQLRLQTLVSNDECKKA